MDASTTSPTASIPGRSLAWTLGVWPAALAAVLGGLAFLGIPIEDCALAVSVLLAPVCVLASIVSSVVAWLWSRPRGPLRGWRTLLLAVALLAFAQWSIRTMPLPARRARAWCEQAAAVLDDHRARTGRYPGTLEEADLHPTDSMPRVSYELRGDRFFLYIHDADDWSGWDYDSSGRTWRRGFD